MGVVFLLLLLGHFRGVLSLASLEREGLDLSPLRGATMLRSPGVLMLHSCFSCGLDPFPVEVPAALPVPLCRRCWWRFPSPSLSSWAEMVEGTVADREVLFSGGSFWVRSWLRSLFAPLPADPWFGVQRTRMLDALSEGRPPSRVPLPGVFSAPVVEGVLLLPAAETHLLEGLPEELLGLVVSSWVRLPRSDALVLRGPYRLLRRLQFSLRTLSSRPRRVMLVRLRSSDSPLVVESALSLWEPVGLLSSLRVAFATARRL